MLNETNNQYQDLNLKQEFSLSSSIPTIGSNNRPKAMVEAEKRLEELLNHNELKGLLGDFYQPLKVCFKIDEDRNTSGKVSELAQALLSIHGYDLFSENLDARKLIGKKLSLTAPGRWKRGGSSCKIFCSNAGFPQEFAGTPTPEKPSPLSFLPGAASNHKLVAFQKEVHDSLFSLLKSTNKRGIVSLPTGAGKTKVAVEAVRSWIDDREENGKNGVVLWLAHTRELCEQAAKTFDNTFRSHPVARPTVIARLWENNIVETMIKNDLAQYHDGSNLIIIAMPISFERALDIQEVREVAKHVGTIIIDEAHRAGAPTYIRMLDKFKGHNMNPNLVGLV